MFVTPSSYSVTPCKSNFARIPERASSIIRDVKRRSLRTCRSKTLPEKRLSGMFIITKHFEIKMISSVCHRMLNALLLQCDNVQIFES